MKARRAVSEGTVYLAIALFLICLPGTSAQSEADVLNFALNLECLEAQFYSFASSGTALDASVSGNGPAPIGGSKAVLDTQFTKDLAQTISSQETAHVLYLRNALGSSAVVCPQVDLGPAFVKLANLLAGKTLATSFSPFNNTIAFLIGTFLLEDLGVTAYRGASSLLKTATYVGAAQGIGNAEAYHAGIIRNLLFESQNQTEPQTGLTVYAITSAIAQLYTQLSSVPQLGIAATTNGISHAILAPADGDGLVYARNPQQVLDIAYFGSSSKPGGVFPKGVNGLFGPSSG